MIKEINRLTLCGCVKSEC